MFCVPLAGKLGRTQHCITHHAIPVQGKSSGQENMDVFHNVLMYARELDRIV